MELLPYAAFLCYIWYQSLMLLRLLFVQAPNFDLACSDTQSGQRKYVMNLSYFDIERRPSS